MALPSAKAAEREHEVGFVVGAKQYLLSIEGLPSARVNDVVADETGNRALVRALSDEYVTALALDAVLPRSGARYGYLPQPHLFSLGEHLFGRIINALGEPIDGGEAFPAGNTPLVLDVDAVGIESRVPMREQLYTGITPVDTLLPIANGQRQLVFGPLRSGKTTFLTDIVLNQRAYGVVCIYAIIGKSLSELQIISETILRKEEQAPNIVIAALSGQLSPVVALAPAVAFLVADHFQKQGKDVLIILDDLDAHAKYLREIALLEERLPGRESYPGDLFYQHAHLMERSGSFDKATGGGSITTLPVIEADSKDVSDLIPTNLMSCTDGHFSFDGALQAEGLYPALSEEQSVTRVGRHAQCLVQKQLSTRIRMLLGAHRRQREYAQFGTQVSEEAQRVLHQGELIEHTMRQERYQRIPADVQVPLLALTLTPFLLERDVAFLDGHKKALIAGLQEDSALQDLRQLARTDTPLTTYLERLEAKQEIFETLCRA